MDIKLGLKLKKLRAEKGITQEEFGRILWVTTSMVGMYETDARKPGYEILIKIADYFGVTTDYLLGRIEQASLESRVSALEKEIAELKGNSERQKEATIHVGGDRIARILIPLMQEALHKGNKEITLEVPETEFVQAPVTTQQCECCTLRKSSYESESEYSQQDET